ncbi:MAG: zinc-binding dehydrogenase [Planctomycetota bacterium]|jgi:NADPH:quinone reductase-like Zn-dependent oxidoreductase
MKAVLITRQGDPVAPNVTFVTDHPDPVAGPGQVVVRTEAAALNHLDLWVGRGVPGAELDYPRVSGSDGCGRVESVGEGVDEAWIGRRVILNAAVPQPAPPRPDVRPPLPVLHVIGEHEPGCMAERFVAPVTNVLAVSDSIDPVDGAAFGLSFLTAWSMIVTRAGLRPGHVVLITGIGGGVALSALAICRHLGATTIVTSRHQAKLDRAVELGADHVVLDTGEDWSRAVRGCTGGRGVDICCDSIGKAVHEPCMKSLVAGGAFVTCGTTSGPIATTSLARLFWLQLRMIGSTMGDMDEFRSITALLESGGLRPVIDTVHDAPNAAAAYDRLERGEQFGKVVVRFSS